MSTQIFNNSKVVPKGWFWILPAAELARGELRTIKTLGREIVLFRGQDSAVGAVDAYCPHMGSHLQNGRVVGNAIQCGYHGWSFNAEGECLNAPCMRTKVDPKKVPNIKSHQVCEKYGMIWLHSSESFDVFPNFEELNEVQFQVDQPELRNCHFTFILGSGVDEDHFNFVHRKSVSQMGQVDFAIERKSSQVIRYRNQARIPKNNFKTKILSALYGGVLTYEITYWSATMGLAKLGFSWLPMYCIFAYRPEDGRSHTVNIYLTPRRKTLWGRIVARLSLALTKSILRGGGNEDRPFQNSIRLSLGEHSMTNPSFTQFIKYVDEQEFVTLGGA